MSFVRANRAQKAVYYRSTNFGTCLLLFFRFWTFSILLDGSAASLSHVRLHPPLIPAPPRPLYSRPLSIPLAFTFSSYRLQLSTGYVSHHYYKVFEWARSWFIVLSRDRGRIEGFCRGRIQGFCQGIALDEPRMCSRPLLRPSRNQTHVCF